MKSFDIHESVVQGQPWVLSFVYRSGEAPDGVSDDVLIALPAVSLAGWSAVLEARTALYTQGGTLAFSAASGGAIALEPSAETGRVLVTIPQATIKALAAGDYAVELHLLDASSVVQLVLRIKLTVSGRVVQ